MNDGMGNSVHYARDGRVLAFTARAMRGCDCDGQFPSPTAKGRDDRSKGGCLLNVTKHPSFLHRFFSTDKQSPRFNLGLCFFLLQMLRRFSALCGPNEQKFAELLT